MDNVKVLLHNFEKFPWMPERNQLTVAPHVCRTKKKGKRSFSTTSVQGRLMREVQRCTMEEKKNLSLSFIFRESMTDVV
jgi:hypothetical protein